jgi:hypothetical protein
MSGSNLPDDVTPADVDAAMAPPDTLVASGAVDVAVDVEVPEYMDDDEIRDELADAVRERLEIDGETVVEIADVRIGEVVDR